MFAFKKQLFQKKIAAISFSFPKVNSSKKGTIFSQIARHLRQKL